jgi:glyoxylase-like metal-dependent hydrolase (beta-lactamase superfamily II)
MPENRRMIGQIEIIALSDRSREREASPLFPDVPEAEWERFRKPGESGEYMMTMNFGCYLLRMPNLTLLIDTGVGGDLLSEIESSGVRLEDVQAVAYTHLHGDHIAWNLSGPEDNPHSTFPNARYYVPRGDWEYFVGQDSSGYNARVHDKFRLLDKQGLIQLVDDGFSISPELTIWETPGHTPGHCSILIQSGGDTAVIVGDAIIHPIQVAHPDWNSTYEQDPDTATISRRQLVEWMAREQSLGGVSHFAAPGFGKMVRAGDTYDWETA